MTVTASSADPIDRQLETLHEGATRWTTLPIAERTALLVSMRERTAAAAERWATAAAQAKGLAGPLAGEEWISGPWALLYALNRYIATLQQIEKHGVPQIDQSRVRSRTDGQVVVSVFPESLWDTLLLSGVRADVWMQAGVSPQTVADTMGVWYRDATGRTPRVCLVLGAGNISSIPPLDVLYKLLADGSVCILKMNPVNDYLGPIFEEIFAPLVEAGYVRFAYGGADVGRHLCEHALVDEVHITGSDKTHDAIVFGSGADAKDRKSQKRPLLNKPITSELGNVSPTIVVPGPWTDADFRFQAENIVTQKLHNGGFNCIASQVLILPSDWDGTQKLVDQIEAVLAELSDRPAYYPGAAGRRDRLSAGHAIVREFGRSDDAFTARTLVCADSNDPHDIVFATEAFSSVLAYTTIGGDTASYLERAVAFANDTLWGTLGANLIIHPKTMRVYAAACDAAIAALHYGCVGVNAWTGVGFLLTQTTWGAFPGHTIEDVRSGIGIVHNSHLFSQAQKSVVYAPFAPFPRSFFGYGGALLPKPPWFVTNRKADGIGEALCRFEAHPNALDAARVALLAMQG
ncbi:MAG: aldehyde dehydrogenase family protein [Vulcanimicrobiaceae bacterium]